MTESMLSPDGALSKLQEGNNRYLANQMEHPNLGEFRRTQTSTEGQHPYATILTCSDSRVPPELIYDCGVGDIFVIRVAGNVVGTSELGSIEYAVDHLGTPALVVLAHSKCGAVKAVTDEGLLDGNLRALSEKILPAVEEAKKSNPKMTGGELVDEAARLNMWNAVADTIKSSDAIREHAKNGKVHVVGAFYDIDSGKVEMMGPHPNQAQLLA